LLARHRTIGGVLRAYMAGIPEPDGLPPAAHDQLRRLNALVVHSLEDDAFDGPALRSLDAAALYLRHQMAELPREHFRVLHLDGDNALLADRLMWVGTVNRVQVHAREIVRDVIETGATALILAHNHPSGAARPSAGDLAATRRVAAGCATVDAVVQDHLILSKRGVFSMRAHGLLDDITEAGGRG